MKKRVYFLKDAVWIIVAAVWLLSMLVFPLKIALSEGLSEEEQILLEAYQKNEIIRLHIIAHSDMQEDQMVKLAVRDAVVETFGEKLALLGSQDFDNVMTFLHQNQVKILQTAQQTAAEMVFDGKINVSVGIMELPAKKYGKVVLPQGQYNALRIALGNGEGENWWCVLYPQLCLALAENSTNNRHSWGTKDIFSNWILSPV